MKDPFFQVSCENRFSWPWKADTDPELRFLNSFPLEHRSSTRSSLSLATFSSWFQLIPVCFTSTSVDRLHIVFGLPWFFLPWGVHWRACLVTLATGFLSVWPSYSQHHFLFRTCRWRGCCSALFHRSSFLTLSCHRTWRICQRQWLTKVCILLLEALVTRQVSQAYRRTLFTLVLKILSLVFTEIACDLQIGLRIWKAVVAYPIPWYDVPDCSTLTKTNAAKIGELLMSGISSLIMPLRILDFNL